MESNSLPCPLWVCFEEKSTGQTYYFNVQSGKKCHVDPDPEGGQRVAMTSLQEKEEGEISDSDVSEGVEEEPADEVQSDSGEPAAQVDGPALDEGAHGEPVPEADDSDELDYFQPWMAVPARVQKPYDPEKPQYIEGQEDFNVWHGKYLSDRRDPRDKGRFMAGYRCDVKRDSGWCQGDLPGSGSRGFCLFFARGCCGFGYRCNFFHHVPSLIDIASCDEAHDIFGRQRFSHHRDDMGGVGSFNSDGRTLYVGDLRFDRARPDTIECVKREVREEFEQWGEVDEVKVLPSKAIAFVRFAWRGNAEFAREAMQGQRLGLAPCIRVAWAHEDQNRDAVKRRRKEREEEVETVLAERAAALGWSQQEIDGIGRSNSVPIIGPIAPYPDTSSQYLKQPQVHAMTKEQVEAAEAEREADAHLHKLGAALSRVESLHERLTEISAC